MSKPSNADLYGLALTTIGSATKLPLVRVDREEFLREQFKDHPRLDEILKKGPQAVFELEDLREKAKKLVRKNTSTTAGLSFASGLPANPLVAIPAGSADVAQYFAFALRMAQQIAYLFGEDDLFTSQSHSLSEEARIRVIGYLGVMFGAAGAAALVARTAQEISEQVGRRFAAQGLMKTTWYPLVKRVGAAIGQKITTKTVEKTVTKMVPLAGGVISGGITYVTFRPMGNRLIDVLIRNLNGEFDEVLREKEAMPILEGEVIDEL